MEDAIHDLIHISHLTCAALLPNANADANADADATTDDQIPATLATTWANTQLASLVRTQSRRVRVEIDFEQANRPLDVLSLARALCTTFQTFSTTTTPTTLHIIIRFNSTSDADAVYPDPSLDVANAAALLISQACSVATSLSIDGLIWGCASSFDKPDENSTPLPPSWLNSFAASQTLKRLDWSGWNPLAGPGDPIADFSASLSENTKLETLNLDSSYGAHDSAAEDLRSVFVAIANHSSLRNVLLTSVLWGDVKHLSSGPRSALLASLSLEWVDEQKHSTCAGIATVLNACISLRELHLFRQSHRGRTPPPPTPEASAALVSAFSNSKISIFELRGVTGLPLEFCDALCAALEANKTVQELKLTNVEVRHALSLLRAVGGPLHSITLHAPFSKL